MACGGSRPCPRERITQHLKNGGHGIVVDDEVVIFVVFDGMVEVGGKLSRKHFNTKKIRDGDLSLARQRYTTMNDISTFVIEPARKAGLVLNGAVVAQVDKLRSIARTQPPAGLLRGVCVIDRVEDGDHDGHAALIGCADQKASLTNEQTLGKFRGQIALDLAEKFSEVKEINDVGLAAII
jgi:hypothetical protein